MQKANTVRITPEAKAKLEEMAMKTGRTQKDVCSQVVSEIWSISAKSPLLTGRYGIATFALTTCVSRRPSGNNR